MLLIGHLHEPVPEELKISPVPRQLQVVAFAEVEA